MSWRIVVDLDLCQSHGTCAAEAPGLFDVPRKSQVVILDDRPPDSLRDQAEAAVKYCPTHAVRILDTNDTNDTNESETN